MERLCIFLLLGNFLCIWDASRRLIIRKIRGFEKHVLLITSSFYNGGPVSGNTSKWICNICSLLCNNGAFWVPFIVVCKQLFSGEKN